MNLFTELREEYHAAEPKRLLEMPATVLRAVDEPRAEVLRDELGVSTLREMADQPVTDWVWRTFSLFRAGVQPALPDDANTHVREEWQSRSCGDWLASPLSSLREFSPEQAQRMARVLGWTTVRQMATDGAFAAAREVSRIVTGRPVAPDEAVTKPLPDYFSSGTRRYMARRREQAATGEASKTAAPAPPEPGSLVTGYSGLNPKMPPQEAGEHWPPADMPVHQTKDYSKHGTYIPRGGGSRGWVENQGVARTELANRYRYSEVVDVERFRRAELEDQVRTNNRGSERKELRMQVRWSRDPAAPPKPGLCLNISLTGAALRLNESPPRGTPLQVAWIHRDDLIGNESPVLAVDAEVMWSKSVNPAYQRQRYDCGVRFVPMSLDAQERLTLLMTGRVEKLLEMGVPAADEDEMRL